MIGNFLVSPQLGAYLHHFEGGVTVCVAVPSMAEHYSYAIADRIAYTLRSHGFGDAHVTDLTGMPASPESIAIGQATEYTVIFNSNYRFAGLDRQGLPQGSLDPERTVYVSQGAAREVWRRLRKMFGDAKIVERPANEYAVEDELKALHGVAPDPAAIKFKDSLKQ